MKTDVFYASPLEGFLLCNQDETDDPSYFGYENVYGNWIIRRINDATGVVDYAYGNSNYDNAWTNRATRTYGKPSVILADLAE